MLAVKIQILYLQKTFFPFLKINLLFPDSNFSK